MRRLILALILLLIVPSAAQAWLHPGGSGGGIGACPYSVDNGCAAAPAGALFLNASAFTTARQSGQAQYKNAAGVGSDHPPDINLPGVDYAVGSTIADASLLDVLTNVIPGCGSYNGSTHYVRCNSGATIEGYRFNGVGLYTAGGTLYTVKNNHFTMTANSCFGWFTGLGLIYDHAGTGTSDWIVKNNTFDFDNTCSPLANTFGKSFDPGLAQQSSENISITSSVMTINSSVTGTIQVGQYLNYAGMPASGDTSEVRVSTNITPGGITSCTGVGCSGSTWSVCAKNLDGVGGTLGGCYSVVVNQTSVASTTGPVESDVAYAAGVGKSIEGKYNASFGWGDLFGTGGAGGVDVDYNYGELSGVVGQHQNFIQSQPSPGVASTIPVYNLNGNFLFYDAASPTIGTAAISEFTAAGGAVSGGYQVVTTKFQAKNNVVIGNRSLQYPGTNITGALVRYLSQGTSQATVSYTLSGGVATVTYISGTALAVGQYLPCDMTKGCTHAVPITSLGTGTGGSGTYNTTNTTDTITLTSGVTRWYPGEIGTFDISDNWFDPQGASVISTDGSAPVTTTIIGGNRTLITGGACNSNAACP